MNAAQGDKKSVNNPGKTTLVYALVFAFSSLYFLSYCMHDVNIWDEGVPLNGAIRMFDGDRPIRDFLAYPPGRYLIYNAAMALGGKQVTSPRAAMALLSGLYAALVYYMARSTGMGRAAFIPTFLFLLMPMYYYYRFFTFCLLITALVIDLHLKPVASGKLIISGMLAASIIWFRFELGMLLIFMLPSLGLYRRYVMRSGSLWKNLLPTLMMLSGVIAEITYVGGWHIWLDYLNKYFSIARGGINQMSLPWPPLWSIEYIRSVKATYLFQDSLHYFFSLVLIAGIWTVFFSRFKSNSTIKSITIMGTIGFGLVIWRTGFGNLVRCSPPLTILTVWLMSLPSRFKSSIRVIGFLFLVGISLDSLLVDPSSYQSIGVMHSTSSKMNHPRFPVRVHPEDCRSISELTSTLEALKASGCETLLALPFHPLINYMTDMKNESYYEWLLPGMFVSDDSYNSAIYDVIESDPHIVVLNDEQFDGIEERRFSRQYPELMIWLGSSYFLWEQIAGFDVYLKKGVTLQGLIDERVCIPLMESGNSRIESMNVSDNVFSSLLQTGNSTITFGCRALEGGRFYSMVFLNKSSGNCFSNCDVRLRINGLFQMETTLSPSKQYVNMYGKIPFEKDSTVQIELSCRCVDHSEDCSVIWIDPGYSETSLPGFVVDRYCR